MEIQISNASGTANRLRSRPVVPTHTREQSRELMKTFLTAMGWTTYIAMTLGLGLIFINAANRFF